MKFRSTIKSIAIMLIACGVLLGGCQYTYVSVVAASTVEQEQTVTSSSTKSYDAKDEEQTGLDSDKSVNPSDDKNTKVAGNTKKVVPDPQKELDIRLNDLSRQVDESAPGFTLWLALLGLAMAVISIVAFLFVRNNYGKRLRDSNGKLMSIHNDLEMLKGDFRALKQSFEEQRGYVDNLSRRAEMDRKREFEYEVKYNAPVVENVGQFKRQTEMPSVSVSSPARDISALINAEHKQIMDSYSKLVQAWRNNSQGAFRSQRTEFKKTYNVQEFKCTNYSERVSKNIPPVYQDDPNGTFWAVPAKEAAKGSFFVYPAANVSYEVQLHECGGMQEAFESNYQLNVSYGSFVVEKPAIFKKIGSEWKVVMKGVLRLS